jgi:hypothetical protein
VKPKDCELVDKLGDFTSTDIARFIDENVVGRYAERDRNIMKRRIVDGILYEPLAEEFDLSVRQTKNIIYKRIQQLLKRL